MSTPFGPMGLPEDPVAWVALGTALLIAWASREESRWGLKLSLVSEQRKKLCVAILAALACVLSLGYVAHYLRGGPRIIDATSYYLEARTFAAGHLALAMPEPSGSFRGRFLLPNLDGQTQAVIFPPGYPALLALGFWLKAPMLIGPLIAACLVVASYALGREVFQSHAVGLVAAVLSVACAALRYHTADTMSHGFSALLLLLALLGSFRGSRAASLMSGLALGWLLATRPVTGGVALLLCGPWLIRNQGWPAFLGLVPGLALLIAYQKANTGSYFTSLQFAYYSLSDGPENCFRLGFGTGIGCRFEHGEFVQRELPNGYGPLEASLVTLRRLGWHLGDVANFVPVALLLPWAGFSSFRNTKARTLLGTILLVIAGYALFYFDGNYPGGGARLFADILPLEHILLAHAVLTLGLTRWLMPAALFGFAFHVSHGHRALRDREGGRPMYEAQVLVDARVTHGLVFVGTDHGFNLGFHPSIQSATAGILVARTTRDDREYALWKSQGEPPAYRYEFDAWHPNAMPVLKVLNLTRTHPPNNTTDSLLFEVEREWPPLKRVAGWAKPSFSGATCISLGRGLRLLPSPHGEAGVQIELPRLAVTKSELELNYLARDPGGRLSIFLVSNGARSLLLDHFSTIAGSCQTLRVRVDTTRLPGSLGQLRLEFHRAGPEILLDSLRVTKTTR